jgi:protein-tyrosine phosphatase
MAEALLRHHFHRQGHDVTVHSAGVLGWNSAGATDHTLTALTERGVDLDGHVSRKMNAALIAPAVVVITMTNDHMDAVRNHHHAAAGRTFVLGQIVRLGEKHGPRTTESVDEWLAAVDSLRLQRRRRALPNDEIRDPLGEPLEAYQALARQLDDLTARLVALLAGSEGAEHTARGSGGGLATGIRQDVEQ